MLKSIFICISIILLSHNGNSEKETEDNNLIVNTKKGLIKGVQDVTKEGKKFYSFMGIPFAQPPVGELKFKEPTEIKPWEGVLDASRIKKACLQRFYWVTDNWGVEDCLYLNVYTPKKINTEEKVPVMVFIHGGAFAFGGTETFGPNVLMREDVVLVTISYRVGILGFLSTEDDVLPGNMGIKDQIMALRWVQENIEHFGGDPGRVTIFGNSAGGASVHIHILSPHSKGLFNNAILISGTSLNPWAQSFNNRELAEKVGDHFKCPLENDSNKFLKCLQNIESSDLLNFVCDHKRLALSPALWTPRVDGNVLPSKPEVLLREGRFNKVNFISGINKDEGALYFVDILEADTLNNLNKNFEETGPFLMFVENEENPEEISKTIYEYYLGSTRISMDKVNETIQMLGDRYFVIGHDFASWLHLQNTAKNIYTYELNFKGKRSVVQLLKKNQDIPQHYVTHTDELFHLFEMKGRFAPVNNVPLDEDDLIMSKLMTKLWTNFAYTGNPTPDKSLGFKWEKTTNANFQHLNLDLNPKMETNKRVSIMKFWASLDIIQNRLLFPKGSPDFEYNVHTEL